MATNAGFLNDEYNVHPKDSDKGSSGENIGHSIVINEQTEKECESDVTKTLTHEYVEGSSKSTTETDSAEETDDASSTQETFSVNEGRRSGVENSVLDENGQMSIEQSYAPASKTVPSKETAGSFTHDESYEGKKKESLKNSVNISVTKISSIESEKNSFSEAKSLEAERKNSSGKYSNGSFLCATELKNQQSQGNLKCVCETRQNYQLKGNCSLKSIHQNNNITTSHKCVVWKGRLEDSDSDDEVRRFSFDARRSSYTLSRTKGRKWLSGRPYQVAVTLMMACGTVAAGTALAFTSVIIPDLRENPTNVYGQPMVFSNTEKDLIASLTSLGAVIGVATSAVLTRRIGKINTMRLIALAGVASWVGIAAAPYTWVILALRVLNGAMNGGVAMTGVSYIVEISDDVMRGPLSLVSSISLYLGQSIGVLPAYWLRYYGVACVNLIYPVVFIFFATFFMPPSPSALVLIGREADARKHLLRLRTRGADVDAQIQSYLDLNQAFQNAKLIDSLKNRNVIKNLSIVFVLFVIQNCSGYPVFSVQTARVLQYSGSTVDPTTGTIAVQTAQIVGVVLAMLCVSKLGRRGTLMVSQSVMGVSVCAMAVYVYLTDPSLISSLQFQDRTNATVASAHAPELLLLHGNTTLASSQDWTAVPQGGAEEMDSGWVPLVCLMLALMACSFGLQNIPMILSSEYFPTAIRSQASSMSVMLASSMRIVSLQFYSPMMAAFTQVGLLAFYSASCLLSLPFTFFCINETTGQQLG